MASVIVLDSRLSSNANRRLKPRNYGLGSMSYLSDLSDSKDLHHLGDLEPMWTPTPATIASSNINATMESQSLTSYGALYRWSIEQPEAFWAHVIDTLPIVFSQPPRSVVDLSNGAAAPIWLPGSRFNIAESCFQADPAAPAIISDEPDGELITMSYAEVRRRANGVANGLKQMGFEPGDAIAVFMPMIALSVPIYLGIILAGCVVVSIADSFSEEQVRIRLRIGGAKGIFTVAFIQRDGKRFSPYERLAEAPVAILVDQGAPNEVNLREGDLLWQDFLGDQNSFSVHHAEPDSPVNVLFSSGTTGGPKAIPWDHTTPIKAASDGFYHHDIHPGDVVAWPTNLGWMMGPWLIFSTMINRGTIALFNGSPLGEAFGRFVQNARVNMLGVVPSMVRRWRQSSCMDGLDWSRIRLFSSTGECSNPQDMRYLSQLSGGKPVIEYCGGTEIGGGYVTSTLVHPNIPSLFSAPTLGTAFVLLDEQGRCSDLGEVFLVPPAIGFSRRLLNRDHQKTYYEGAPAGPHGEPLRRHGDELQALPGGYFRVLGRTDDSMNLGGIKIDTMEIERVLVGVDGACEVAAVAIPPSGGGPNRLVLFVVLENSTQRVEAERLRAAMQQAIKTKLNPLFRIYDIRIVRELPRTASGKVMRRQLRASYDNLSRTEDIN